MQKQKAKAVASKGQSLVFVGSNMALAGMVVLFCWLMLPITLPAQSRQLSEPPNTGTILVETLSDSTDLQAAFDSLQKKKLSPSALAHKADSLRHAFAEKQAKLLNQQGAQPINKALQKATAEQVPKDLLPAQVKESIPPLPTGNVAGQQLPIPQSLPAVPGLPAAINPAEAILNKLAGSAPAFSAEELEGFKKAKAFFASHSKELAAAQRKLSRYNGRLDRIESIKHLPKNYWLFNPLKGKPWKERIIVGTLWQFSNQQQYHIDLGPSLAWRITDLFSVGAGFQYRMSVSIKHSPWINSADKVYGYYGFFDGQIRKGFFGRLQYEDLSTLVPRPDPVTQAEMHTQQWVKGFSVGLGKTYTFYKKINGYSLVQYNLMHKHGETPYLRPLQAKVGFFINGNHLVKKKQKRDPPIGRQILHK